MRLKLILTVLLLSASFPMFAQIVSQGRQGSIPIYIGGGYSRNSPDWGPGRRMDGFDVYGGWTFYHLPILNGLGFEGDARSVFFDSTAPLSKYLKSESSVGGGLNYRYMRIPHYRPYAKYLLEAGKTVYYDPPVITPLKEANFYSIVQIMGGGMEVQVARNWWVRGDYSYQMWSNPFGLQKNMNPVGVTLGVTYEFMRLHPAR